MPLINNQPNAILKFCLTYHWCKASDNVVSDLATQSLTAYVQTICALTFFHRSTGSIFAYIANYSGLLVFLLSGSALVLLIWITFKRIDSAILELTFSCLKNIVMWNTHAIKTTY